MLRELEAFFDENRDVILVDLQELEKLKPKPNEEEAEEEKVNVVEVESSTKEDIDLNLDLKPENIAIEPPSTAEGVKEATFGAKKKGAKVIRSKKLPTVPVDPFAERAAQR